MKIASMIAGLIATSGLSFDTHKLLSGRSAFRSGTPSRKKPRNKDGLPAYYPGAKLARKASQGRLTLR